MKVGATLRLTVEFRVEPLFEIARGAEGERKNSSPERLSSRQFVTTPHTQSPSMVGLLQDRHIVFISTDDLFDGRLPLSLHRFESRSRRARALDRRFRCAARKRSDEDD